MASEKKTLEYFRRDTAQHAMTVVQDNGIHRHLRFQKPGTWNCGFDIVTYPGYLVFSGDMGCFAFSRIHDMFEFFRDEKKNPAEPRINPGYWAEKLQAVDRHGGHQEFVAEAFRAAVLQRLADADVASGAKAEIKRRLADEVFPQMHDGEGRARQALYDFECEGRIFEDFGEHNCREYTLRFLWCCYALVWAIEQYDASRSRPEQIAVPPLMPVDEEDLRA